MGVRVVFPDMGKDPSVQLIEKTITENGTYDAITDGANGYSKVNVNVEGGGGSSDFSKVNLTLEVRENGKFGNYRLTLTDFDNNATSLKVGTTEGEPRYFVIDSFTVTVDYNSPVTEEIYLYQNNYFIVTEPSVHQLADFVVTGNAEAVEVEFEGSTVRLVKVYGDCTISVVGSK